MSVTELQKKIIEKISETQDTGLLENIFSFLGADEAIDSFYDLSDDQIAAIERSQQQIKDGHYFTNDEVNKEIDEWLKK